MFMFFTGCFAFAGASGLILGICAQSAPLGCAAGALSAMSFTAGSVLVGLCERR